jgi:hypothetical protein
VFLNKIKMYYSTKEKFIEHVISINDYISIKFPKINIINNPKISFILGNKLKSYDFNNK